MQRVSGYLLVAAALIAAINQVLWAAVEALRSEDVQRSVAGLAQAVWALGGPTFVATFVMGMIGLGLLRSDSRSDESLT